MRKVVVQRGLIVSMVLGVFAALWFGTSGLAAPLLTLTPNGGAPGSNFTIAGSGFPASSTVRVYWDGALFDTDGTNRSGSFNDPQTVPKASSGVHTVSVTIGTVTASTAFTVTGGTAPATATRTPTPTPTTAIPGSPAATATSTRTSTPTATASPTASSAGGGLITLNPASGTPGIDFTIAGSGFAPSTTVFVFWDGTAFDTDGTNTTGTFSDRQSAPQASSGAHTVSVKVGTSTASATFTISGGTLPTATPTRTPTPSPTPSPTATLTPTATPPTSGGGTASWRLGPTMQAERVAAAAVTLNDGSVLVSGGTTAQNVVNSSAERWSVGAGQWTLTGPLVVGRQTHSATLLQDGRVLVAGGTDASGANLASAELYDPATGTWSLTGSMATARSTHTATLLPDGSVLVAGGCCGPIDPTTQRIPGLPLAEVFTPATETWHTVGSMATPRYWHTATLLSDGSVLAVGGVPFHITSSLPTTASAERFVPQTGQWQAVASMATMRAQHSATLLPDGSVLITGGNPGGCCGGLASAERFSPATATWTTTAAMAQGRRFHTATLLGDGTVLVLGGYSCCSTPSPVFATAELYLPASGTWNFTVSLTQPRYAHTAVLLPDGSVLVAGGNGYTTVPDRSEQYVPQ